MKCSREEFFKASRKSITFIGMSGVGKTHLSSLLEAWGWARYSCDYEIGTKYLKPALAGAVDDPNDIRALSDFIGQLGDPAKGGLALDEFKRRQNLYMEAECAAVRGALENLAARKENFVHDSTGSLCEILDEDLIATLGEKTFFVYLKATKEEEQVVLARAQTYPKPLFFPPALFEGWVDEFLALRGLESPESIDPPDFSRWVFPRLFESRLPKYQALADRYGVTIETPLLKDMKSEAAFLDVIARGLG